MKNISTFYSFELCNIKLLSYTEKKQNNYDTTIVHTGQPALCILHFLLKNLIPIGAYFNKLFLWRKNK